MHNSITAPPDTVAQQSTTGEGLVCRTQMNVNSVRWF